MNYGKKISKGEAILACLLVGIPFIIAEVYCLILWFG